MWRHTTSPKRFCSATKQLKAIFQFGLYESQVSKMLLGVNVSQWDPGRFLTIQVIWLQFYTVINRW